jgi:hypothetical protein
MGYNQLSGTIAAASGSEIISTYFSGAYSGDGASLEAVNHTTQTNTAEHRIPFFDSTTAVGPLGNQYNIRATSSFTFNRNTDVLTLNGTGSFSAITLNSASSEAGVLTKYLALNASNQIVLTSSYGDGNSGAAVGPTGSLQFHSSNSEFSGSENLIYDVGSTTLTLTGTLTVSGTINANELNIDVTNKNVINLDVSGSTKFGDTLDDTHEFTGSLMVSGTVIRNRVSVTTDAYPLQTTDYFVAVQTNTIAALSTITLPAANTLQNGQSFVFKDEGGSATTYNIKITASAADLIDGTSFIVIESPYGALNLYTNGTDKYFIY